VEYESEADDVVWFFEKKKNDVYDHRVVSVQGVKIDTASIRVEDGIGEEVIKIYEHRGKQNEIDFFPFTSKKYQCQNERESEVKKIVNEKLHGQSFLGAAKLQ
jgi:hypothetical protein